MAETDLKKIRGQYKAQLTRFTSFVDSLPDFMDNKKKISELQTRLNKLETVYDDFEKVQSSIELVDESDEQIKERELFENQFYTIVAVANVKISSINVPTSPLPIISSHVSDNINVKLPQISIPEFSGAYDTWLQFHDCFHALIPNNGALTNVQKFYYLQTALNGEASSVIRALEVSNDNYSIAWKMLKERYENKRIIIHTHEKKIYLSCLSFQKNPILIYGSWLTVL
ncbi:hypothetical protein NQ314_005964 [Rhamnusium bicolor]|uniref:Uncharacterized protein n=1 Tax=Rhamnusium bicolor TaxID=1586634 RepID=A0AAV8ZAP3_9CUCU|nr:hypothetical protein NQ314_005964 [Rhamnusium bicolor]